MQYRITLISPETGRELSNREVSLATPQALLALLAILQNECLTHGAAWFKVLPVGDPDDAF